MRRIFVPAVICLLCFLAVNFLYLALGVWKNRCVNPQKMLRTKTGGGKFQILNLGSGSGRHAIVYSETKHRGLNMAMAPQNFYYDLKLLERARNYCASGCIVILVVMPLSFGREQRTRRQWKNLEMRYADTLEPCDLPHVGGAEIWLEKVLPLLRDPLEFCRWLKILRGGAAARLEKDKGADICRRRQADALVKFWHRELGLENLRQPQQAERMTKDMEARVCWLKRLLDFCREADMRPVILIPPVSGYLRAHISAGFLKEFMYDNIRRACGFRKIPVLDYYQDQRFEELWKYTNGLFLEEPYNREFSGILFQDIEKLFDGAGP